MDISNQEWRKYCLAILAALLGFFQSPMAFAASNDPSAPPRDVQQLPGPGSNHLPGGMAPPGSDPFHLLINNREVQQDLRLTETQIRHLSRIDADFRTQMRESTYDQASANQPNLPDDRDKIARVLTPQQLGRFREIMLQIEAPCGIVQNPDDSARIGLSSSQTSQINGLCQHMWEQLRSLADNSNRDNPNDPCAATSAVMEKEHILKGQLKMDVDRLLTDPQRKAYVGMQGNPISLSRMKPPNCEPDVSR